MCDVDWCYVDPANCNVPTHPSPIVPGMRWSSAACLPDTAVSVTSLELRGSPGLFGDMERDSSGLTGTLPSELGLLTNVRRLWLLH